MTGNPLPGAKPRGFYSLHRETYSVTGHRGRCYRLSQFLFAASRDVQRDCDQGHPAARCRVSGFYSLHRETYSVTPLIILLVSAVYTLLNKFLFAASRDVQRDVIAGGPLTGTGGVLAGPFLFAASRDVQRDGRVAPKGAAAGVSIRCIARRTA